MATALKLIALGLLALAVLSVVGLWAFQRFGTHRFAQAPLALEAMGLGDAQVLGFVSEDGQSVQALMLEGAPDQVANQPVILSFFGNFAGIDGSLNRLRPLQEAGATLVMLQYRGANGAPGQPGEEAFAADARALYDQLDQLLGRVIPPEDRVIHGLSLGGAVAGRLASERDARAVILEASPERLCQFWTRRYRGLPFCALMWRERYDLVDRIGAIGAPLVLVHGAIDPTVPVAEARALAAAAGPEAELVILPEGGHADLHQHGLFDVITEVAAGR